MKRVSVVAVLTVIWVLLLAVAVWVEDKPIRLETELRDQIADLQQDKDRLEADNAIWLRHIANLQKECLK